MKKAIVSIVSIIIGIVFMIYIACIVVVVNATGGFPLLAPSYVTIEIYLQKNIYVLSYVADNLLDLNYGGIEIRKVLYQDEDKNNMRVWKQENDSIRANSETVPIPDDLKKPIEYLLKTGVNVISSRSHNTIGFTLWSSMNESRGIKYSRTGEEPSREQIIVLRRLSQEGWYYYVHNYEKWKAQNPQLFE